MQLENNFTVPVGMEQAWAALNDPEKVAPCMPGATLESVDGDAFVGTVTVKLGPISLTYKGKGEYVERDEAAHRVVIDASGRDARGNGTAQAKVVGTLVGAGDETTITVVTDLTITGRPAQFGRGVISDVGDKILGQFASCLASKLGSAPAAAPTQAPAAAPTQAPAAAADGTVPADPPGSSAPSVPAPSATPPSATPPSTPPPAPVKLTGPIRSEVDAIDLLDTAGAPVLKRLVPVLAGLLVVIGFVAWRRPADRV